VIFSNRYSARLDQLLPHGVTAIVFLLAYVLLFVPLLVPLGLPAVSRLRFGSREVNRVLD
jgi:hypothetical protein